MQAREIAKRAPWEHMRPEADGRHVRYARPEAMHRLLAQLVVRIAHRALLPPIRGGAYVDFVNRGHIPQGMEVQPAPRVQQERSVMHMV